MKIPTWLGVLSFAAAGTAHAQVNNRIDGAGRERIAPQIQELKGRVTYAEISSSNAAPQEYGWLVLSLSQWSKTFNAWYVEVRFPKVGGVARSSMANMMISMASGWPEDVRFTQLDYYGSNKVGVHVRTALFVHPTYTTQGTTPLELGTVKHAKIGPELQETSDPALRDTLHDFWGTLVIEQHPTTPGTATVNLLNHWQFHGVPEDQAVRIFEVLAHQWEYLFLNKMVFSSPQFNEWDFEDRSWAGGNRN